MSTFDMSTFDIRRLERHRIATLFRMIGSICDLSIRALVCVRPIRDLFLALDFRIL